MNFKIELRLAALGLALGLLGALIVGITVTSGRQVEQVSTRLGLVDVESMRIADRFKDKLRYASDQMRRYARGHDPAGWEEFLKASQELEDWMRTQAPHLAPGLEQEVLKQMESAHAVYMQNARKLHDRMEATGEASASPAESEWFTRQSRRLHDLGLDLARVHSQSRNEVLERREPDPDAAPAIRARSGGAVVPVRPWRLRPWFTATSSRRCASSWWKARPWPSATRSSPRWACWPPASRMKSAIP